MTGNDRPYRDLLFASRIPHVDGLRAIAILSVVGYHAGVPGFASGFVGVDVFFVISGFLIVNQIVAELQRGAFSVFEFYARRALRILPAFLLVLLVTLALAGAILVTPYEWARFSLSGSFSAIFASNFYFLSKQDYFDVGMFDKPLLHTWSLSVEEQFYLVVPLLLVGLFAAAARLNRSPGRVLAVAAAAIFAASLIGCIAQTSMTGRNHAFYLMHWRAWEFVAGGAVGFLAAYGYHRISAIVWEIAGLAGLALVAAAASLGLDGGFFPGYAAVVPVAGTALLIAAGLAHPRSAAARLLSLAPMVWIGLVSYSWYLWHWPLLTLARIADFGDPGPLRDAAMVTLALALAVATYFLVEKPVRAWRRRRDVPRISRRVVAAGVAACVAVMAVIGGAGGLAYRAGKDSPIVGIDPPLLRTAAACSGAGCGEGQGGAGFLAGDSHADMLLEVLAHEAARGGVELRWPFKQDCRPASPADPGDSVDCDGVRRLIAETGENGRPGADFFIFIKRWNPRFLGFAEKGRLDAYERALAQEIALFSDGGTRRVLVLGPVPEFRYEGVACLMRARDYGVSWDKCSLPRGEVDARRALAVTALRRAAGAVASARFVDPIELFCDADYCRPYAGTTALFKDDSHLTRFGAALLYEAFEGDFRWAFTGKEAAPPVAATSPPRLTR